MRNLVLCVLLSLSTLGYSPKRSIVYVDMSQQPSSEISITLAYDKIDYTMSKGGSTLTVFNGQSFTFSMKNLTGKKYYVTMDLVAKTVCGTEVIAKMSSTLKPNEDLGSVEPRLYNQGSNCGTVSKQQCEGNFITYEDNGQTYKGYNRISSLEIRNFKIKEILPPKKNNNTYLKTQTELDAEKNANKKGNSQMTDDEKLNQALMNKMNKDFDDKSNAKKNQSTASAVNSTNKTKATDLSAKNTPVYVFVQFDNISEDAVYISDVIDVTTLCHNNCSLQIYGDSARIWFEKISGKTHNNNGSHYFSNYWVIFNSTCSYADNNLTPGGCKDKSCLIHNKDEIENERKKQIENAHYHRNSDGTASGWQHVIEIHGK